MGQIEQRLFVRRIRNRSQGLGGTGRLVLSLARSVRDLPRSIQWRPSPPRSEPDRLARWRRAAVALAALPVAGHTCSGSVGLPSARSSPMFLPRSWLSRRVIEHVVDQLKGRAQMHAVRRHGRLDCRRLVADDGAELGRGLEQLGGLAVDHPHVALLGDFRVMAVEQLQHFALGDGVGGFRQDLHDPHAAHFDHHFEGARIQEIADQHAGLVAPDDVGGRLAAAHLGGVHDVVVQQGGGVDEFDDGGQRDMGRRRRNPGPGCRSSTSSGRRRLPPLWMI